MRYGNEKKGAHVMQEADVLRNFVLLKKRTSKPSGTVSKERSVQDPFP
jgi:hypothetical protein